MNKYERYAANNYLSKYPEDYDMMDIISDVLTESENISIHEIYENLTPEGLAEYIEDMIESLETAFND